MLTGKDVYNFVCQSGPFFPIYQEISKAKIYLNKVDSDVFAVYDIEGSVSNSGTYFNVPVSFAYASDKVYKNSLN